MTTNTVSVRCGVRRFVRFATLLAAFLGLVAFGAVERSAAAGSTTEDIAAGGTIFQKKCVACHTIGEGALLGPDLGDVHKRREHGWLVRWLIDPAAMTETDPEARKLVEARGGQSRMKFLHLKDQEARQVLAYIEMASTKASGAAAVQPVLARTDAGSAQPPIVAPPPQAPPSGLRGEAFEEAKELYFDRCAGCHGLLRKGATGPNIEPKRTSELGVKAVETILTNGTPGGMPAFGSEKILSPDDVRLMASYLLMPAPDPPAVSFEEVRESWKLLVPVARRPRAPVTKRQWDNYFGVILRDAGKVAIVDGNTKELAGVIDTGFAVHILRSSSTGRYFYAVGRDGRVSMIDLWPEKPTLVAQVKGCVDARSIDASKYKGYEDKLLIEGCYWPPQYVVFDGQTLEPKKIVDITTPAYDTGEELKEVRVASIVPSHHGPQWVVSLKESGHVALVDYSKPDFPVTKKIAAERFLHDGGWDRTKQYFMVAANMRDQMAVIDVKNGTLVTKFKTGVRPHPGRGANWEDPEYGWVNGTTHLGEGKLVIYGADPVGKPQHAWKVVRELPLTEPGGLFIKTHPKSPWVWLDSPLSNDPNGTRQICIYSKKEAKIDRCFTASERGRAVHFEYNKAGTEVWVSVWDKEGELIVYDDKTLKEKTRIKGDWLVTPTGKFNVFNTAGDVY
ncbi:MAG: c-type cytochrome [Acidobacteria bacterium]|nr:c-type cytochrome [Acidobacteriota bacterium]